MMLNIAHVVAYPYHGGTQEYARGLARAQTRLGHNVTMYVAGNEVNDCNDLRIIMRKPIMTLFRNPISFSLPLNILKDQDHYDVLHIHLPFPVTGDLVALLTRLRKRTRINALIATYHFDIDLDSGTRRAIALLYSKTVLNAVLKAVDRIIVSSGKFIESSLLMSRYQRKVVVAPIGIDAYRYTPCYEYPPRIIFVGRIIPEKGIHYLIKALKYLEPKTELVIIGKIIEHNYYRYLLHLSEKLDLKERIMFTGYVPQLELVKFYQSAQVVVLPSTTRLESFGIALLEAMATGKPIVATAVIPGAVELIKKSGCGIIVAPRNPLALAQAIEATRKNPEHIGRRARKYVEEKHDWKVIANKVVMVYGETLAEKRRTVW